MSLGRKAQKQLHRERFHPHVVGHRLLCQEALAILVWPRKKRGENLVGVMPGSSPVSRLIFLCCARASPGIAAGSGVVPSVSHSGLAFIVGMDCSET